jgi:hypothetical protein
LQLPQGGSSAVSHKGEFMKLSLAGKSMSLFVASVIVLVLYTMFESAMANTSLGAERLITFILFVLPAGAGAVLGGMSLARKEGRTLLAVTGLILNGLFALFHLMIVLIAG